MSTAAARKPTSSYIGWIPAKLPPARMDIPWSVQLPAAKGDPGKTVAYSIESMPKWMHFDPATRTLRGTPSVAGQQRVKASAHVEGGSTSVSLRLDVEGVVERFGHTDPKTDTWIGRPQELGSDDVILDPARPADSTRVQRVQSGVLALHQSGRITDAEAAAAVRFHEDWSRGTGHPLRVGDARFLGVSPGGVASPDGIPVGQLDAATRYREASAAIGEAATGRLVAFCCLEMSLGAAAKILGVSRQDLGGQVVAALQRLSEHYVEVDRAKDPKAWNRRRREGR